MQILFCDLLRVLIILIKTLVYLHENGTEQSGNKCVQRTMRCREFQAESLLLIICHVGSE